MLIFNHILLAAGWLFFVFLHSLMAALWFKAYIQQLIGDRYFTYYRLAYSVFAAATVVIVLLFQFFMNSKLLMNTSIPVLFAGIVFSCVGLSLMMVCIKKYFLNLSGVDVLIKKNHTQGLEKNGLHAYVRHPLYAATLLFIWSLLIIFPYLHNLIACIIITIYTVIGIIMEERKLLIEFGESYRAYSKKIPMIIPSLSRSARLRKRSL